MHNSVDLLQSPFTLLIPLNSGKLECYLVPSQSNIPMKHVTSRSQPMCCVSFFMEGDVRGSHLPFILDVISQVQLLNPRVANASTYCLLIPKKEQWRTQWGGFGRFMTHVFLQGSWRQHGGLYHHGNTYRISCVLLSKWISLNVLRVYSLTLQPTSPKDLRQRKWPVSPSPYLYYHIL